MLCIIIYQIVRIYYTFQFKNKIQLTGGDKVATHQLIKLGNKFIE